MTTVEALEQATRHVRAWLAMHAIVGYPRARAAAVLAAAFLTDPRLSLGDVEAVLSEQAARHISRMEERIALETEQ